MPYTADVPIIERMVAENIDKVRRARGMSVTELARLAGMPTSSVSRALSGNRRINVATLDQFAAALDVMPAALLGTVSIEINTDGA